MIREMNEWGKQGVPFLFIIDFDMEKPVILPLNQINPQKILFDINGRYHNLPADWRNRQFGNWQFGKLQPICPDQPLQLKKYPVTFEYYKTAFDRVQSEQRAGNSYLLNLTFPTKLEAGLNLLEIFFLSRAKYKLWYQEQFVVFSPEAFVMIKNGCIASYPMKGTIDASLPHAEELILQDEKELAEHITIVDLIRNDLGKVAKRVRVKRFRYIDKIITHEKNLLQVSSEITGELEQDYPSRLGEILFAMLPAGSVTGAPKKKTVEIIKAVEGYQRGYYTGIMGYFDGVNLESAVMIRFIEKTDTGLVYKSGGGITIYSRAEAEYRELLDKVYVPVA
jgi:para-aminobenzoate synthetase component 1